MTDRNVDTESISNVLRELPMNKCNSVLRLGFLDCQRKSEIRYNKQMIHSRGRSESDPNYVTVKKGKAIPVTGHGGP
jgi:hypothetical protein